ncbi:MAG: aminoacyl-tRNA hydrolase [Alphaproteobacteria bacterium]|nr:aminoacyl-tRNA hydrolase [Alphaproteobacteria bacterium]
MLLLVGLGNPGAAYQGHRHNVGFMAVDAIARAHNFGPVRVRFRGELREGTLSGAKGSTKTLILKPLTYMNESGNAVREAVDFYKLELSDVVVIYDEIDLAPGKLRVKTGGGNAGHNGLRSISAHVGNDYRRVRIGIGHPGIKEVVPLHVLHDFAKSDRAWLDPLIDAIADAAPYLADGDDAGFMNKVALLTAPPKPPSKPSDPKNREKE